jgi:hypothetical protein
MRYPDRPKALFDIDSPEVGPVAKKILKDKYGPLLLEDACICPGHLRLKEYPTCPVCRPEPKRRKQKHVIAGEIELPYCQKL